MRKHRDLSSQKIIDTVFNLVKRHGQRKITFSYVAKQLGIHSEALYTYFRNRHDLIIHVAIEYFHRMLSVTKNQLIGINGNKAIIQYLLTERQYGLRNIKVNNMAFSHASDLKVKSAIKPLVNLLLLLTHNLYKGPKRRYIITRELENQIIGDLVNEEIGLFNNKHADCKDSFISGINDILSNKIQH